MLYPNVQNAFPITTSDSADLAPFSGLIVNVAGTVKLTLNGTPVTLTLPVGTHWLGRITRVWATGTAATGLTGLVI